MKIRNLTRRRFWEKVEKTRTCWVWKGSKFQWSGYGEVRFLGKRIGAHRLSYILSRGAIPDGKSVLHKCDNRPCVRPSHLYAGTQLENMRDKLRRGRGNNPKGANHPFSKNPSLAARGEAHHKSTLREIDIPVIRREYAQGVSQHVLAKQYQVTPSSISYIVTRKTWAHVS